MAADLHIHVFEGIEENDLASFSSNTLGSKHFNPRPASNKRFEHDYDKIARTPNVWIGEVSWLKAAVFEDHDNFVPEPVQQIHDLIGETLPVLDDELERKLLAALGVGNDTGYSVSGSDKVSEFLRTHKGKRLFTVSW